MVKNKEYISINREWIIEESCIHRHKRCIIRFHIFGIFARQQQAIVENVSADIESIPIAVKHCRCVRTQPRQGQIL